MGRVVQASSAAETAPTKVPRSCSDVFRLWAAVLVSPLVALAFEMVVYVAEVSGLRERPTGRRATVEFDFGAQLIAWNSFALTYLLLGIRAFSRIGRADSYGESSPPRSPPPGSSVGCSPAAAAPASRCSSRWSRSRRSPRRWSTRTT